MDYISLKELIVRFGAPLLVSLTDRGDSPSGQINQEMVARAVAGSNALIDSYIAVRYSLPLASAPPLLADLAAAIILYKLHSNGVPDRVEADYKAALARLSEISRGIMLLPDIKGAEPAPNESAGVQVSSPERDVNHQTMRGYI